MKIMMRTLTAAIAGLLILQGCEGLWANKMRSEKVNDEIKSKDDFFPETPAAIFVDSPTLLQRNSISIKRDPVWTQEKVETMSLNGQYLHSIMKELIGSKMVNYSFAQDEANTIVTARLGGTIKDCLETISASTGLSYVVTDNSVKWSQYVTESFPVAYIPGKYNYNIGSAASEGAQLGSSGESVSFGSDSKQYSNVSSEGGDAFDELSVVLGQIVSDFGEVSISKTTSSVIVTTTRSRMERVKNYMSKVEKSLGRQIAFDVKILRFTSNSQGQAGIDWNTVQNKATGQLKFAGGDLSSIGSSGSGAPITFAANKTIGSMSGSDVLLQILQEQGKVSVVNQPRIVTQVNRVAELELSNLQGYIAKTSITNSFGGGSGSGTTNPTVSMTPGVVQSGYSIYAMGNISGEDKVILHMASTYTDLIGITRKEVMDSAIESPQMTRSKMVNTVVLRNGATMIIGGLQLQSTAEDNASPISPSFLPTRNSHRSSVTETIALVTPVIINME